MYSNSSPMRSMRSSGGRLTPSRVFSTNRANCGPSSGGKPNMSAMTRIGMCWAYSAAASTTSRPAKPSINDSQNARVASSWRPTALLVNAGRRSLRASWWNGGSEEIGGVPPTGAMSRGGRKLLMMMAREENESVSYATAATSSYRVGSQPPPNRSVCAIGQRRRRSSHTSGACWAYSGSRCEKSVAQSVTGPVVGSTRVPSAMSGWTWWKPSAERSPVPTCWVIARPPRGRRSPAPGSSRPRAPRRPPGPGARCRRRRPCRNRPCPPRTGPGRGRSSGRGPGTARDRSELSSRTSRLLRDRGEGAEEPDEQGRPLVVVHVVQIGGHQRGSGGQRDAEVRDGGRRDGGIELAADLGLPDQRGQPVGLLAHESAHGRRHPHVPPRRDQSLENQVVVRVAP